MGNDYVAVGVIARLYGFRGEILIKVDDYTCDVFPSCNTLFLDFGPDIVPFVIKRIRTHNRRNVFRIELEGVCDEDKAKALVKKPVCIPSELLKSEENDINLYEIIGIEVHDKSYGYVGVVTEVNTSTPQTLLIVSDKERHFLIPFVNEFIVKIDKTQKQIFTDLPQGLLSLNA